MEEKWKIGFGKGPQVDNIVIVWIGQGVPRKREASPSADKWLSGSKDVMLLNPKLSTLRLVQQTVAISGIMCCRLLLAALDDQYSQSRFPPRYARVWTEYVGCRLSESFNCSEPTFGSGDRCSEKVWR